MVTTTTLSDTTEDKPIEKDFSERFATIVGLVPAKEEELPKVRSFIMETMGKEMLTNFDSMWIRNDPERALIIAECEKETQQKTTPRAMKIKDLFN